MTILHKASMIQSAIVGAEKSSKKEGVERLTVIAPLLPHISNHPDFDALCLHPNVSFQFIQLGDYIPIADLLILPDSTCLRNDLQYLKDFHWDRALTRHLRQGGKLLGICAGFYMLGNAIHDPNSIEGVAETSDAFGWLLMETTLAEPKPPMQVFGKLSFADVNIMGFEIHAGTSIGDALTMPALWIDEDGNARAEGAISADKQIAGTCLHGLFHHAEACNAWLTWAGLEAT